MGGGARLGLTGRSSDTEGGVWDTVADFVPGIGTYRAFGRAREISMKANRNHGGRRHLRERSGKRHQVRGRRRPLLTNVRTGALVGFGVAVVFVVVSIFVAALSLAMGHRTEGFAQFFLAMFLACIAAPIGGALAGALIPLAHVWVARIVLGPIVVFPLYLAFGFIAYNFSFSTQMFVEAVVFSLIIGGIGGLIFPTALRLMGVTCGAVLVRWTGER